MSQKNTKTALKVVDPKEQHRKFLATEERRKKLDEACKLTRSEIEAQVRAARVQFESARDRLDGVKFDIMAGINIPESLDHEIDLQLPLQLVESFDPRVAAHSEVLKSLVDEGAVGDTIYDLKDCAAESGFQLGVLAGAIFAGCSEREIDRFERGLVYATMARPWRVKP